MVLFQASLDNDRKRCLGTVAQLHSLIDFLRFKVVKYFGHEGPRLDPELKPHPVEALKDNSQAKDRSNQDSVHEKTALDEKKLDKLQDAHLSLPVPFISSIHFFYSIFLFNFPVHFSYSIFFTPLNIYGR